MARIIVALIRHGDYHQLEDTPSAHQPFGLTHKGKQQALSAAATIQQMLQQQQWQLHHQVDTSSLLRAWQTARTLCQPLQDCFQQPAQLCQTSALFERGLGVAGNLTIKQIEQVLESDPRYSKPPKNWKSNSHYQLPLAGAESLMQAGQRVAQHIQTRALKLSSQVNHDTLQLFVGHGAAFRHGAHHLGVLAFEQIAQLSMYHAQPVYLEYLGDSNWVHIAGPWKVRKANSDYND